MNERQKAPDDGPMAHQNHAPESISRDRWHVIAEEGNPKFPQLAELTILWPEDGSRLVTTAWCGPGGWSGQWGARKLEEYGAVPLAWRELPDPWMGDKTEEGRREVNWPDSIRKGDYLLVSHRWNEERPIRQRLPPVVEALKVKPFPGSLALVLVEDLEGIKRWVGAECFDRSATKGETP